MKKKKLLPLLTILFLAPFCGEALSTSSPPMEFFMPFSFLFMLCLYGCGALMIRELVIRWQKGWMSIFLLGAAYGIYEEGLVVRSFFDPNWGDLGLLAEYGRFLGVNWVWSASLTLFHAVVSICMPILLTHLLFPQQKDVPWLGKKGLRVTVIALLLTLPFGILIGMKINFIQFMGCVLSITILFLLAKQFPVLPNLGHKKPAPCWWLFILGFSSMIALVAVNWLLPAAGLPVILDLFLACVLPLMYLLLLLFSGVQSWGAMQQWWFAFGVLTIWGLFSIQAAYDPGRVDDTTGMALVGLFFFAFMVSMGIRIRLRSKKSAFLKQENLDVPHI